MANNLSLSSKLKRKMDRVSSVLLVPKDGESSARELEEQGKSEKRKLTAEMIKETHELEAALLLNRFSQEVKDELKNMASDKESGKQITPTRFKVFNKETLHALLRYNDRPRYNLEKAQLCAMVCEYFNLGCPPRCPKCAKGYLRFSNGTKKYGKKYYWCPGSTSDGINFHGCNFKADRNDIQREPWKSPS